MGQSPKVSEHPFRCHALSRKGREARRVPHLCQNKLVRDAHIAEVTGMSKSWGPQAGDVARRGTDHVLAIDVVMIGSVPRYRLADVESWHASKTNVAK